MRKNLEHLTYSSKGNSNSSNEDVFMTAEQIEIKGNYNLSDIKNFEHLNFGAGMPPFLRGPYSSMYI